MPNRPSLLLALLLLSITQVACGHGEGRGTTAEELAQIPELPLPSLVDPSSLGVLRIDLSAVTGATLFRSVSDWIDVLTAEREEAAAVLLRSALRAREIVVFLVVGEGEPRTVALLRGEFQRDDAIAFHRDAQEGNERLHGPFVVYDVARDGAVTLIGRHTMVLGRRQDVDAVLDRQLAGGNGSFPTGEVYAQVAETVGFSRMPIALAVVPTEAFRAQAQGASDPMLAAMSQAHGLGFGLDIRNGLVGRAVVHLDSAIAAMGIVTLGRAQLGSLPNDPEIASTGLGNLLRFVTLDREGSSIIVDLNAPPEPSQSAFDRFTDYLRTMPTP